MNSSIRVSIVSSILLALAGPGGALGADRAELERTTEVRSIQTAPSTETAPARRVLRNNDGKKPRAAAEAVAPNAPMRSNQAQRPAVNELGATRSAARPMGFQTIPSQGGTSGPNLEIEAILQASSPEGFPNSGFCGPNAPTGGAAKTVRFFVRNTGDANAPASTAAVHFTDAGMVLAAVGSLIPGQSKTVQVDIPQACWPNGPHGTCDFLLEVDRNDDVDETEDDADNYENGECMLPGT